jgi:hypothetical protein
MVKLPRSQNAYLDPVLIVQDSTTETGAKTMTNKMISPTNIREFVLAGKSHFTIVSLKTGSRLTYRIQKSEDGKRHYVRVLTGPDNTSNYTFLGTIFDETTYRVGSRSKISQTSPSQKAFLWLWQNLREGRLPETVEFWHEGKCGRCGRLLTDPTSIERGIGPVCRKIMNQDQNAQWIAFKDEFARREAEQEKQAYMYEMVTKGV